MSAAKFTPGRPIRSLHEFACEASAGRPIYYRHKVTAYGWYQNWNIHFVQVSITQRHLFTAHPVEAP